MEPGSIGLVVGLVLGIIMMFIMYLLMAYDRQRLKESQDRMIENLSKLLAENSRRRK